MEAIEAQLSDEQHAKVTRVFAELHRVQRDAHAARAGARAHHAAQSVRGMADDPTAPPTPPAPPAPGRSSNAPNDVRLREVFDRVEHVVEDRWGIPVRIKTSRTRSPAISTAWRS